MMPDYSLVLVDHQPDFSDVSLVPVDHDPLSADDVTPAGLTAVRPFSPAPKTESDRTPTLVTPTPVQNKDDCISKCVELALPTTDYGISFHRCMLHVCRVDLPASEDGTDTFSKRTWSGKMDRDAAVRIDGMLIGARANLDGIAHHMKNNLSPEEFSEVVSSIGRSMSALIDISSSLHSKFPDITPKELLPPGD